MQSSFIEVSIRTDVDSGELLGMLHEGETLGSWEKDGVLHVYWPEDRWNVVALEDLRKALRQLGVNIQEAELTIQSVPDQDWNAVWAASLHPIRLGRQLRIRQTWHESDPGFNGIELVIDPKRAFGTGYHATTQLVIEWLEDHIRGGESVLDVGTGSGILAMAAIRFGAASALGIDKDSVALECAREYAAVNGFGSELELRVASFDKFEAVSFDMIVANLDGRTMPGFCEYLRPLMNPGAVACFSGLQDQDFDEVESALRRSGLEISERRQREDWLALTVKRRNATD